MTVFRLLSPGNWMTLEDQEAEWEHPCLGRMGLHNKLPHPKPVLGALPRLSSATLHVSHLWEYLHRHPGICLSIFWVFKKSTQSIFQLGFAISLE